MTRAKKTDLVLDGNEVKLRLTAERTKTKQPVHVDWVRFTCNLRNAPTQLMKQLDYGRGYRYAHDEEGGFAAGASYLPDGMAPPGFYQPVPRGLEIRIGEKLQELRARNAAAQTADQP